MFFFEGSACAHCGEVLTKNDDVVACPVCGAPYHRECYKELGECAYAEKHGEGFVWKKENAGTQEQENGGQGVVCGICGTENQSGRLYCKNCASPLFDKADGSAYEGLPTEEQGPRSEYDVSGSVITDGTMIEGVPAGDLRRFLGNSAMLYVPMFYTMAKYGRKISINFFAMFFHGLWFISRKMYALGISLLAVQLGIYAFQSYNYSYLESVMTAYEQGGNAAMMESASENPALFWGLFALTLVQYVICFVGGLFGNRIYMKWCIRKIKKINRRAKDAEQFNAALASHSGSGFAVSVIFMLLYFIAQFYISGLFG